MSDPKYLPFARPAIDEAAIADVAAVLRSGWITSGPKVKAFEAELLHRALHDPLTGLANRTLLYQRIEALPAAAADRRDCLIYLDLDGFKAVNDTLGHSVGDLLLKSIGARMVVTQIGGKHQVLDVSTVPTQIRQEVMMAAMAPL